MSFKCYRPACGKTVYHAEKIEHDGKTFHSRCLNLWKKEVEEEQRRERNALNYEKTPDVSPAYYRTGDVTSGSTATMLSGAEERARGLAPSGSQTSPVRSTSPNASTSPVRSTSPSAPTSAPKFCPECGSPNGGGKFCGECGFKFF